MFTLLHSAGGRNRTLNIFRAAKMDSFVAFFSLLHPTRSLAWHRHKPWSSHLWKTTPGGEREEKKCKVAARIYAQIEQFRAWALQFTFAVSLAFETNWFWASSELPTDLPIYILSPLFDLPFWTFEHRLRSVIERILILIDSIDLLCSFLSCLLLASSSGSKPAHTFTQIEYCITELSRSDRVITCWQTWGSVSDRHLA